MQTQLPPQLMVATAWPAHAQPKMSLLAIVHSQMRRSSANMSTTAAADSHTVQPLHHAQYSRCIQSMRAGWAAASSLLKVILCAAAVD
jgi:hypothetical protein